MTASSSHLNFEQLIALVEAGKFPIGVSCADPMTARLYDAWTKLMCHASRAGRQASIAYRHIDNAMSEMGNNQGGYYHLKKCLEEMNAQDTNEAAAVVLCRQYHEELNDVIPAAIAIETDLRAIAKGMKDLAPRLMDELGKAEEAPGFYQGLDQTAAILRGAADLLKALMEFTGNGPQVQEVPHERKSDNHPQHKGDDVAALSAPVGSDRFFDAIEALLGVAHELRFCAGGNIVTLECGTFTDPLGELCDAFRMSVEGVLYVAACRTLNLQSTAAQVEQRSVFMHELKLQVNQMIREFEEDIMEGAE
ncbi:hypothetical protein [Aeromonas enteropelogenes]|uniref:hypothetical protein n=1 Tax=Aeromonas enteropelogenes TaxID=29489 RepID=UPI003BA16CD1